MLSKSKYLKGLQCGKRLYLNKKHDDHGIDRDEVTEQQEAIFAQGHDVGALAQQLFPGGKDMTPDDFANWGPKIERTREAIEEGIETIYEAAFVHDSVFVAVDILHKTPNGWHIVEVKSSTKVKPVNKKDASVQYYVLSGNGLKISDVSIMHINTDYVLGEELDLNELFVLESVLEDALALQDAIPNEIQRQLGLLNQNAIPGRGIGPHCMDPYDCDFIGYCWSHIPDYTVFDISDLRWKKRWKLYDDGILNFEDIPEDFEMGAKQWIQVQAELDGEDRINMDYINDFLEKLTYPIRHLDFETISYAIPKWPNSKPYRQLPFQYSMHLQTEPRGEASHFEFLAPHDGSDPRPAFIEQLINDCGTEGDILVYNIKFEKGVLNALINRFPEYTTPLQAIVDRLKDLMKIFEDKAYYVPEMKGSYSIKKVLPSLVPHVNYDDLAINNGGLASNSFIALIEGTNEEPAETVRQNLLDYCQLDTYAMVLLLNKLYEL